MSVSSRYKQMVLSLKTCQLNWNNNDKHIFIGNDVTQPKNVNSIKKTHHDNKNSIQKRKTLATSLFQKLNQTNACRFSNRLFELTGVITVQYCLACYQHSNGTMTVKEQMP